MCRYLIITLFILLGNTATYGQQGFRKIVKLDTFQFSIIKSLDITRIGDHYYSYGYGAVPDSSLYTLFVIKSDEYGNILDQKYIFEGHKWLSYWPYIVKQPKMAIMDDSRFALVLNNIDNNDTEVFCVDTSLNKQWHTTIPKYSYNGAEIPKKVITDGQNIYIGIAPLNKNGKQLNTKLIKLDSEGNILEVKLNNTVENFWGLSFNKDQTALLLTGIQTPGNSIFRNHKLKLDLDFNVISSVYQDVSWSSDFGHNITLMDNYDDYITTSYDVLPTPPESPEDVGSGYALSITRRDTNLNIIWKLPLFNSTSHNNGFSSIIPSKDGHYYAFGQVLTFMDNKGQYPSNTSAPVLNSFVTKFTEDGLILWQRLDTFDFYAPWNFSWTEAGGIVAMDDGGVMVCGSSQQFGPEDRHGWMMRIDADGCVVEGDCANLSNFDQISPVNDFMVYPNPTSGVLSIALNEKNIHKGVLQYVVYNSVGLTVKVEIIKGNDALMTIDLSSLNPGIYFIKVINSGRDVGVKKVVLSR